LPRHRGREPLFHAVLANDREVGVTVHKMTERLDAGDIYAQQRMLLDRTRPILKTAAELWRVGARLFCQLVVDWDTRPPRPRAQDEALALYHSAPTREEVRRFRRQGGRFL
jgi:methionyl-tRNA formyltransferase